MPFHNVCIHKQACYASDCFKPPPPLVINWKVELELWEPKFNMVEIPSKLLNKMVFFVIGKSPRLICLIILLKYEIANDFFF